MTDEHQDGLVEIADGVRRGKARFSLALTTKKAAYGTAPFTLSIGAPRTIQIPGGFIISLGMRRDQLEFLRDRCSELLGETTR